MSQNNDNSAAMGFAIVATGVALMFIFVFAIGAFLALILTVLSLFAWSSPLQLTKTITITPEEARGFVYGGLGGAILAPVFTLFAAALLKFQVQPDLWPYIWIGGYVLGSFGTLHAMEEQSKEDERAAAARVETLIALPPSAQDQPRRVEPKIVDAPAFRFASWDDEEELK